MSLATILVHIDDATRCEARVDAAIRLALGFQAHLVGVNITPGFDLSPSIAALLPQETVDARLGETGQAQHDAEQAFRQAAAAAGLAAIDWRAPAGSALDAAVDHARCADLVVLGQREGPGFMFADELTQAVLLSSGRPALIVPFIGAQPTLGENVLVAWDGGREISRAIGDAMPLLERAKRVRIVSVGPDRTADADAPLAEARLAAWLRPHGIEAAFERDDAADAGIGEWLLSRAADFGSDLIVMGGYAHSRVRALVLGGVTRTMLQSMTVPVLMSH
jgi:nucleotide-binding universal stress UspA family protein